MRQLAPQLENLVLFFSRSTVSDFLWPHGLQHARLSCPSPSPGICSNSRQLSQWCHPISVTPFSFCPQSFPASGSFLMSRLFTSGGRSIGASASASVLLMNMQDWFPLGLTGLIGCQTKLCRSVRVWKASISRIYVAAPQKPTPLVTPSLKATTTQISNPII